MDFFGTDRRTGRIAGVVIGIVVDNRHPNGDYAVKVKFPWVRESDAQYTTGDPDDEDFFSTWARVAQLWAGAGRGVFALPEVDDEVLVAFEHGDVRRPYVLGSLWNGVDRPPYDNESQDGANNVTTFHSRTGHMLQFVDDEEGGQKRIVLQTCVPPDESTEAHDSRDGHFIVLDHSDGAERIEIYDREKRNYVLIDATENKITLESMDGDIEIKAGRDLKFSAQREILIESGTNSEIRAGANYTLSASGTAEQRADGNHVIRGAIVEIN